jgi:dynein light chain 1, axonemal
VNNAVAEEADFVKLYCQMPPINKMDASLVGLKNCERLALSTNNIDRMTSLGGMNKLKILSLGRNLIKKVNLTRIRSLHPLILSFTLFQIEKLEDISSSLEELWISYNQIASLDGLSACSNLTTLYISNNLIKQWSELDKLVNNFCYIYIYYFFLTCWL